MNYRAIWISDVHLGSRHAQVEPLLNFLRDNESKYLYIVGDFIDGWELKRNWRWLEQYNVLIQKILRKNRKQTRVILLYGNHDEFLEQFAGMNFGGVRLMERAIHISAKKKRYLVLHGHQFDGLTHFNHLLERLGSRLYDWILYANLHINKIRRHFGFGYWSFASYLKMKAKGAVKYVTEYEEIMVQMARKSRVQGIICGHIHRAEIKEMQGITYMNCGDWVESCTALVEDMEGNFQLIKYHENPVHSPGGGPGPHDASDGDEPDLAEARPSSRGGGRRPEPTPEFAGLFRKSL